MAQIPVGSAAQRVIAQPEQDNFAPQGAFDTGAAQLGQAGQALVQIGADALRDQRFQERLGHAQARADAGAAMTDHEIQVRSLVADTQQRLTSGQLDWRDAQQAFSDASSLIDVPKVPGLAGPDQENYQKGISKNIGFGNAAIGKAAFGAQVQQTKGTVDSTIDSLGKLAGMPNTDTNAIVSRLDSLDPVGNVGYGAAWEKKKQDAKDAMFFDATTQRLNASRDSLESLADLKADLTGADGAKDPTLATKLDSNKRNALIAQVETRTTQLQTRLDRQNDQADAMGSRAIGEMQKQVATGVPASSDQLASWADQVKGTQYEGLYATYTKDIADTVKIMALPIDQQRAEIQRQQAYIDQHGGSPDLQARVKRLGEAVDANVKMLETTPLLFAQNRTGVVAQPLDFGTLAQPGGVAQLTSVMQDRIATVAGLRKTYGNQVAVAPLLPQEADALRGIIAKSPDSTKEHLLGLLGKTLPPDAFAGVMKQIGADAPTTAAAFAASRQLQTTLGNSVASTLLTGAAILKDKSAVYPKTKGNMGVPDGEDALLPYFNTNVGDALPAGDPSREQAFQVFRAAYMGAGQHLGTLTGAIDSNTAHGALAIATGGVATVNSHQVLKPWAMTDSDFTDKLDAAIRTAAPSTAFSYDDLRKMRVQNIGNEGGYMLVTGRKFVPGSDGKPLVLQLGAQGPVVTAPKL